MGHPGKIRYIIIQKIEITLKNEVVIVQKEDQERTRQANVVEKEKEVKRVKIGRVVLQTSIVTGTTLWLKIKIEEIRVPAEDIARKENEGQTSQRLRQEEKSGKEKVGPNG